MQIKGGHPAVVVPVAGRQATRFGRRSKTIITNNPDDLLDADRVE